MSSVISVLLVALGALVAFLNNLLWKKLDRMTSLFMSQINIMNNKQMNMTGQICKLEGIVEGNKCLGVGGH